MVSRCAECDIKSQGLYYDPRTPPLDEHGCLCSRCFHEAVFETLDDYQEKIRTLISNYSKSLIHMTKTHRDRIK